MTTVRPPTEDERLPAFPMKRGHYRLSVPPDTFDRETMQQAVDVVLVVKYTDGSKRRITTPMSKARRSHYYSALWRSR